MIIVTKEIILLPYQFTCDSRYCLYACHSIKAEFTLENERVSLTSNFQSNVTSLFLNKNTNGLHAISCIRQI